MFELLASANNIKQLNLNSNTFVMLGHGYRSTMVELLTNYPEIQGSNSVAGNGRDRKVNN